MLNFGKSEFFFSGVNSQKLFGRIWKTDSPEVRGSIIGIHGYSEHSGCYRAFARFLNQNGFHLFMLDLPGHGQSDGARGNIDNFEDYLSSFDLFLERIKTEIDGPQVLFAHSLGGLISIRYLESGRGAERFQTAFFSSPLLGLSPHCFFGVGRALQNKWGRKALHSLTRFIPNLQIPGETSLGDSILTHDKEMNRRRRADHLIKPIVTTHWTREFLSVVEKAHSDVDRITTPLAVFQAGDDRVTDAEAAEDFVRKLRASPKYFKKYPGLFHEILNEIERERVMGDMLQWLELCLGKESVVSGSI